MNKVAPLVAAALLGALISGAGTWIAFAREVVPRDEIIGLIQSRSPYVPDKRVLGDAIEQMGMLAEGQQTIRMDLALLTQMVEDLRDQ